ncbi:hypothetical protein ANO11243_095190 [Dothideomycetidae sp. 11243]|nr:hypothetical protein ANO11243_095190 [fungal sp. No.11243]
MAETAGIFYAAETLVEGAVAAAKGIYDPTLPLKVTLTPVKDVSLPRHSHTVSMVKGRAYIFGGITTGANGAETIADNGVHVIILPISATEGSDYKVIPADNSSPAPRFGHSAVVIEDQIFIYGGSSDLSGATLLDEQGAVWVFDTKTSKWTKLMPHDNVIPPLPVRLGHASVATPQPRKPSRRTDEGLMPQLDADPAQPDILPEPEEAASFGTLIIRGGHPGSSKEADPLNDVWAFDIGARTWSSLPSPPQLSHSTSASLAIVGSKLYTLTAGQIYTMTLATQTFDDKAGQGALGITALSPWAPVSRSESGGPGNRAGASLYPVTTGQGRNYLLLLGGGDGASGDIWTLQLQPEGMTAASIKDAARMAIGKGTGEKEWAEVRYFDEEGVMVQEGQDGRGIGARSAFAACKNADEDGGTVFVHGGLEGGQVRGDGMLVSVSI